MVVPIPMFGKRKDPSNPFMYLNGRGGEEGKRKKREREGERRERKSGKNN